MKALTLTLLLFVAASADARDLLTSTEGMTVGQFRALYPFDRYDAAKIALETARKENGLCNQRKNWDDFYQDMFHKTGVYKPEQVLNEVAVYWLTRRCRLVKAFGE